VHPQPVGAMIRPPTATPWWQPDRRAWSNGFIPGRPWTPSGLQSPIVTRGCLVLCPGPRPSAARRCCLISCNGLGPGGPYRGGQRALAVVRGPRTAGRPDRVCPLGVDLLHCSACRVEHRPLYLPETHIALAPPNWRACSPCPSKYVPPATSLGRILRACRGSAGQFSRSTLVTEPFGGSPTFSAAGTRPTEAIWSVVDADRLTLSRRPCPTSCRPKSTLAQNRHVLAVNGHRTGHPAVLHLLKGDGWLRELGLGVP